MAGWAHGHYLQRYRVEHVAAAPISAPVSLSRPKTSIIYGPWTTCLSAIEQARLASPANNDSTAER